MYIGILLGAHPILRISRIRVKQFLYVNFKNDGSKMFIGAKNVTDLAGFQGVYSNENKL
jgi:hypothetical protein